MNALETITKGLYEATRREWRRRRFGAPLPSWEVGCRHWHNYYWYWLPLARHVQRREAGLHKTGKSRNRLILDMLRYLRWRFNAKARGHPYYARFLRRARKLGIKVGNGKA